MCVALRVFAVLRAVVHRLRWRAAARGARKPISIRSPIRTSCSITIDTLRADALGCYGGPAATPALDRLAAEGVRFDFAHAHAVVTLPSHASILTGQYPFQHGLRDNSGYRLPAGRANRGDAAETAPATRPPRSSPPFRCTRASA